MWDAFYTFNCGSPTSAVHTADMADDGLWPSQHKGRFFEYPWRGTRPALPARRKRVLIGAFLVSTAGPHEGRIPSNTCWGTRDLRPHLARWKHI